LTAAGAIQDNYLIISLRSIEVSDDRTTYGASWNIGSNSGALLLSLGDSNKASGHYNSESLHDRSEVSVLVAFKRMSGE
jgi:hypothetical protein